MACLKPLLDYHCWGPEHFYESRPATHARQSLILGVEAEPLIQMLRMTPSGEAYITRSTSLNNTSENPHSNRRLSHHPTVNEQIGRWLSRDFRALWITAEPIDFYGFWLPMVFRGVKATKKPLQVSRLMWQAPSREYKQRSHPIT